MACGIGVVDPGAEPGGSTTKNSEASTGFCCGAELGFDTRNKGTAFAGHDTALIGSTTQMLTTTLHLLLLTTTST